MIARSRGWLVAAYAATVFCASSPAQVENPCLQGGAEVPVEGGIGGTGAWPDPADSDDGIGGTGITQNDTGVIGTVTGFASICVGGIEIHYGPSTPVRIDGQPTEPAALATGDVVQVLARGDGQVRWARDIAVEHIVTGPITAIDAGTATLHVIDQPITVLASTRGGGDLASLGTGDVVRVSGMRRDDGTIVASRLTRTDGDEPVRLTGPLARSTAQGFAVGSTRVIAPDGPPPSTETETRVVGRWINGALHATSIEARPALPFGDHVTKLSIEGFAHAARDGRQRIGGVTLDAHRHPALQQSLEPAGDRIRVEGSLRDRRLIVERVERLHDRLPWRPERGNDPAWGRDGSNPPQRDGPPRPGRPDQAERSGRPDRAVMPDRPGRPGLPDRPGLADRPERPNRPTRPDNPGRPDGPGRPR